MARSPLEWTADEPGRSSARHLAAFRVLLLAHFAAQSWAWTFHQQPVAVSLPVPLAAAAALVFTLLIPVALLGRGRLAALVGTPFAAVLVVGCLPLTPNHTFLAMVLLALCAFLDPDLPEDEALLLQSLRWIAVLIFFWAGLQKALHGLYFRGEFLTWMMAHGVERWVDVFGWMVPSEELERLRGLPRYLGSGPYRLAAPLFLAAANTVWVGEIALALGMLLRRTRMLAALGAIALVFVIQLAPREFMFALLYTNLLLLFVPGEWNRRLLVPFLLAYAYLLAAVFLGVPGQAFLKPETLL